MVSTDKNWIYQTIEEVFLWCESADGRGYDPFDGLTSPLLKKLPQNRWMRLAFLQLVKRSIVNLRPLLGIEPQENAMAWAAVILGALEAYQRGKTSKKDFIQKAVERLWSLQTEGTSLWGYPFPWQARAFYLEAGEPNLVLSALCLRALAKVMLTLPPEITSPKWRAQYQQSAAALATNFYHKNAGYFSYTRQKLVLVHNANLLGAEALAWLLPLKMELSPEQRTSIATAVTRTLAAQATSGRWPYGEQSHHQWCDNFHTAYNLITLANLHSILGGDSIAQSTRSGLAYYLAHAFTKEGKPRYYDNRLWPLETHSAAVGLICLKEMKKGGWIKTELAREWTEKICDRLRRDFYLGGGRFLYQRGRWFENRTVFTRWTQSWVYYGLEAATSSLTLATKVEGKSQSGEGLMGHQPNRDHIRTGGRDLLQTDGG